MPSSSPSPFFDDQSRSSLPGTHRYRAECLPAFDRTSGVRARVMAEGLGLIAGECDLDGFKHACVWRKGKADLLCNPDYWAESYAIAINAKGFIAGVAAGNSNGSEDQRVGVVWRKSYPELCLPPQEYDSSSLECINAMGVAGGFCFNTFSQLERRPYTWFEGTPIPLLLPERFPYAYGEVDGINAKGIAAGKVFNSERDSAAAVWIGRKVAILPTPSGAPGGAFAITDSGFVLGMYRTAGVPQFCIWRCNLSAPPVDEKIEAQLSLVGEPLGLRSDYPYIFSELPRPTVIVNTFGGRGLRGEVVPIPVMFSADSVAGLAGARPVAISSLVSMSDRGEVHYADAIGPDGSILCSTLGGGGQSMVLRPG